MTGESRRNRLIGFYFEESQRCSRARAYLAASVFLAAALEAAIMEIASIYPSRVRRTTTWVRVSKRRKNLLFWTLGELIELANEIDWLPAKFGVKSGASWSTVKAGGDIGDFVEIIREMRNLVHAGKYLRHYPSLVVRAHHYKSCFDILQAATATLRSQLEASIHRRLARAKP